MNSRDRRRNIKAIRLLQNRSDLIEDAHQDVSADLRTVKNRLARLTDVDKSTPDFAKSKQFHLDAMNRRTELAPVGIEAIYNEAEKAIPDAVGLTDILAPEDWAIVDKRMEAHIEDFDSRYGLDRWDYAIAGGCGLFAAMLDWLCVKAPAKPTVEWTKKVDGVFNRGVQKAFNRLLPPELSRGLGKQNTIGGADSSTVAQLIGGAPGALSPTNHRLRSLSHDPILGFLFGVLDMKHGTCTVVEHGSLKIYKTTAGPVADGLFARLGRLFGHLVSDVNAPSSKGNRGMGLPVPLMGVLRMSDGLPVGDSDLGKQIEYMYAKGYDLRHFVAVSIPVLAMEVVLRVLYAFKQVALEGSSLGETLIETMPTKMNPRFRIMLAMAYGTMAGVNGARVFVTKDILSLNYAAWTGLVWNGFHAIKWALLDRNLRLWKEFEQKELEALEHVTDRIHGLAGRAERLPV